MLQNKTVVIGVTGSIAAYKMADIASALVKMKCDVHVIMTKNATNFINPITFETLTANKCLVETFDRNFQFHVAHVSLAEKADVFLIAPASANVIAKLAHGIADDMLTTTALACKCKKLIAPAMNTNMYNNAIVQNNIKILESYGYETIKPEKGFLACRAVGDGKLADQSTIMDYIMREIVQEKDLVGKKILVTAGPTQESIDPVRYITNHSTGKMGYEIARAAMERGADVTLVSGNTSLEPVPFVKMIDVTSAEEMFNAVVSNYESCDIIIKAAAVADYRPSYVSDEKIKKSDSDMSINLERTQDILKYIGQHRSKEQYLCGFSMETSNTVENSRAKLDKKGCDLIVANNLKVEGAGFGTDTNVVTLITKDTVKELEKMDKKDVANAILDFIKNDTKE